MKDKPYMPRESELVGKYVMSSIAGSPSAPDVMEFEKEAKRGILKIKADALREAAGIARSYGGVAVNAADEINMAADRNEEGELK